MEDFPLIPIHLIPRTAEGTLKAALAELPALEASGGAVGKFALRERIAIEKELTKRVASARVEALLNGTTGSGVGHVLRNGSDEGSPHSVQALRDGYVASGGDSARTSTSQSSVSTTSSSSMSTASMQERQWQSAKAQQDSVIATTSQRQRSKPKVSAVWSSSARPSSGSSTASASSSSTSSSRISSSSSTTTASTASTTTSITGAGINKKAIRDRSKPVKSTSRQSAYSQEAIKARAKARKEAARANGGGFFVVSNGESAAKRRSKMKSRTAEELERTRKVAETKMREERARRKSQAISKNLEKARAELAERRKKRELAEKARRTRKEKLQKMREDVRQRKRRAAAIEAAKAAELEANAARISAESKMDDGNRKAPSINATVNHDGENEGQATPDTTEVPPNTDAVASPAHREQAIFEAEQELVQQMEEQRIANIEKELERIDKQDLEAEEEEEGVVAIVSTEDLRRDAEQQMHAREAVVNRSWPITNEEDEEALEEERADEVSESKASESGVASDDSDGHVYDSDQSVVEDEEDAGCDFIEAKEDETVDRDVADVRAREEVRLRQDEDGTKKIQKEQVVESDYQETESEARRKQDQEEELDREWNEDREEKEQGSNRQNENKRQSKNDKAIQEVEGNDDEELGDEDNGVGDTDYYDDDDDDRRNDIRVERRPGSDVAIATGDAEVVVEERRPMPEMLVTEEELADLDDDTDAFMKRFAQFGGEVAAPETTTVSSEKRNEEEKVQADESEKVMQSRSFDEQKFAENHNINDVETTEEKASARHDGKLGARRKDYEVTCEKRASVDEDEPRGGQREEQKEEQQVEQRRKEMGKEKEKEKGRDEDREKRKRSKSSEVVDDGKRVSKRSTHTESALAKRKRRRPVLDQEAKDYSHVFPKFHHIFTMCHEKEVAGGVVDIESALKFHLKLYQSFLETMKDYEDIFIPDSVSVQLDTITEEEDEEDGNGKGPKEHGIHWARELFFRCQVRRRAEVGSIVKFGLERFNCYLKEHKLPCWRELPKEIGLKATYNLLWSWSRPKGLDRSMLLSWQRVNHFPGARAITRKDELKKNLQRYMNIGGLLKEEFSVMPATFTLPKEYLGFVDAFSRGREEAGNGNLWIMKPVSSSRGRGITVVSDIGQVCYGSAVVIQKYIMNPLLLDGYKFDLRIYVLVTSFNPLEAFIYKRGFVRLATVPYSNDLDAVDNQYVHLTNSSINKGRAAPMMTGEVPSEKGGTKLSLSYLWRRLSETGVDVELLKEKMERCVLKTLVVGDDCVPNQINSFDLFGFDILIDENLKPWLIEVNSSPSMGCDNALDHRIKEALIYDTMRLVNPVAYDRRRLVEVLERRLSDAEEERKRPYALPPMNLLGDSARAELNEDLTYIMHGQVPRAFGELPGYIGDYKRLAPGTAAYDDLIRIKEKCIYSFRKKKGKAGKQRRMGVRRR